MSTPFEAGQIAYRDGKSQNDNPHVCGVTKLGTPKLTEAGVDWLNGWLSAKPARVSDAKEIAAAASVDVSRFRRKSNRYYSG